MGDFEYLDDTVKFIYIYLKIEGSINLSSLLSLFLTWPAFHHIKAKNLPNNIGMVCTAKMPIRNPKLAKTVPKMQH